MSPSVVLIWRRNRTWRSARQYAHIQLKFQANFSYTLVVLADVVDVDKPELLRLGSKRQWHTSRRISFGATQYKYDDATCKYYRISGISRCAGDGASDQLCGEVEASQVSSAHQAATRRCSNERDQQAGAVILAGCGDFVRDTTSAGGLFYFGISVLALTRHRPRSMPQRVVDGLSMRQVTITT